MLKALWHVITRVKHCKPAGVLALHGLGNKAIKLCILVIVSAFIPPLVKEYAAYLVTVCPRMNEIHRYINKVER
jgi:uncharacterized membrane protein YqaE (UPF0057 family)